MLTLYYIAVIGLMPSLILAQICAVLEDGREMKICCEGYMPDDSWNDDSIRCIATCRSGCDNGNCTLKDHCVCHQGYRNIDNRNDKNCEPICETSCLHGYCAEPNICGCHPQYKLSASKTSCDPICSDCLEEQHRVCIAPDKCVCAKGYQQLNQTCVWTSPRTSEESHWWEFWKNELIIVMIALFIVIFGICGCCCVYKKRKFSRCGRVKPCGNRNQMTDVNLL